MLGESVVLLDEAGRPAGYAPKEDVHHADTPLHLAFSCYLVDPTGLVLITRRALSKRSWPGVWTNSFCGHPAPGESLEDAVRRHGLAELSVAVSDLTLVLPDFRYRAVDPNGVVENEVCPVFVARTDAVVAPAAHEVADWAWVTPSDLVRTAATMPQLLSPWSVLQLPLLAGVLGAAGGRS